MNFRQADMKDQERMIALYSLCYPQRRPDKKWLHWYINSPYGTRIYVMEHNEKLVGAVGYMNLKFRNRAEAKDVGLIGSVCTHPEYRMQGIFTSMLKLMREHEPGRLMFVVPNPAGFQGQVNAGARIHVNLEVWGKRPTKTKFVEAEKMMLFESKFLERFNNKECGFGIERDARFLNWRIVINPTIWYENFKIAGGYVVLKHYKQGDVNKVHVMDLQYDQPSDLQQLVALSENCAYKRKATIDLWLIDNNLKTLFSRWGFSKNEQRPLMVYGDLHPLEMPAWFCYADNDTH